MSFKSKPDLGNTYRDSLELPIILTFVFLICGRKLKHPEKTHGSTERTCKLCPKGYPAGNQSDNLLAEGKKLYQLSHCVVDN